MAGSTLTGSESPKPRGLRAVNRVQDQDDYLVDEIRKSNENCVLKLSSSESLIEAYVNLDELFVVSQYLL